MRNSPRDRPGRQPTRLNQNDFLPARQIIEHRRRHQHRFARAGRRRDDDRPAARSGNGLGSTLATGSSLRVDAIHRHEYKRSSRLS